MIVERHSGFETKHNAYATHPRDATEDLVCQRTFGLLVLEFGAVWSQLSLVDRMLHVGLVFSRHIHHIQRQNYFQFNKRSKVYVKAFEISPWIKNVPRVVFFCTIREENIL